MKKFDADAFYASLEETGEEQVRTNLAEDIYDSRKARLARDWLERQAERRARARENEEMEIQRAAADAARDAADAARSANTRATIALIIAAVTAIALVTDLLFQWTSPNGGAAP